MGVAGTVGFLKRLGGAWTRSVELRDVTVIIDVTNALYWLVKARLLDSFEPGARSMDLYGTSMVRLGQLYRCLLACLRARNCPPHIVYEGARLSDLRYSPMSSKAQFLESSARGALNRLHAGRLDQVTSLPHLATCCLKEVVAEFQLPDEQLHQAAHEVYPVLERLAREHDAIVFTNHSDFIFSESPRGFVWMEELEFPADEPTRPWTCRVYLHELMMRAHKLTPGVHSPAVRCLSVLLRPDFSETYARPLNRVLQLQGAGRLALSARNRGTMFRRLCYLMDHWPQHLTTRDSVRYSLLEAGMTRDQLERDYDASLETFVDLKPFDQSLVVCAYARGQDHIERLAEALERRESSVEFLADPLMTEFRRTNVQDTSTFRSTFSLADRAKRYLLRRLYIERGHLFDRERSRMIWRQLDPGTLEPELQRPLANDAALLAALFQFSPDALGALARRLANHWPQLASAEDSDAGAGARTLALLLLLARYALRVAPRTDYEDGPPAANRSRSSSPPGAREIYTQNTKYKFYAAIVGSFLHHTAATRASEHSPPQGRNKAQELVAAAAKVAKEAPKVGASIGSVEYITCKHMIEALNSTLHAYKELNSLYNFPGPRLLVSKCYDAVLIYKLATTTTKAYLSLYSEIEAEGH